MIFITSRRWLNCRKVTHLRFYDSGKVPRPLDIISKFAFFEKMVNEISSVDHYEEIKRDTSKRLVEYYFISGYEKNGLGTRFGFNKFLNTIILKKILF